MGQIVNLVNLANLPSALGDWPPKDRTNKREKPLLWLVRPLRSWQALWLVAGKEKVVGQCLAHINLHLGRGLDGVVVVEHAPASAEVGEPNLQVLGGWPRSSQK